MCGKLALWGLRIVKRAYRGPIDLDVESVRDHFEEAVEMTGFHVPTRTKDESELFRDFDDGS